jgi:GABA permease
MDREPIAPTADRQFLSRVVLVLAALAAVLAAAALLTALLLDPPALGWIGFGVLSLIVFGIGLAATLAVPRLRVSPLLPATSDDRAHRLLVVADATCRPQALSDAIGARDLSNVTVHLVVPVRVSHLHFLTEDESRERRQAEVSLARTLRLLHERGLVATGAVGDDKPLESMTDALGRFAATRVLLAIPPERESYWLERGLLPKARALVAVEVRQVVVPAALSEESSVSNV